MAQLPGKTNKKNYPFNCIGCSCDLPADHTGIMCLQSHAICPDCSKTFVSTVMEEPTARIPVKCMLCRTDVVTNTFERQLTDKQLQTFLKYYMQFDTSFLGPDELVVSCPFCEYWEINIKSEGQMLFYCQSITCKKISCYHCKKNLRMRRFHNDELDAKDVEDHFECAALAPAKEIWDKALQDGSAVPCPECGVAGMKNESCTHMTCPKCRAQFCYVCGLSFKNLDKARPPPSGVDNMLLHNEDWKTNSKRCPMSLEEIYTVDSRWPKEETTSKNGEYGVRCVEFYHEIRTKQKLKEAMKTISPDDFRALCRKYNIDKNCGFNLKDVSNEEHIMIKRKNQKDKQ